MSVGNFRLLPVEDIQLDFKNPRIAKWVEMYGEDIPVECVALALGKGSSEDDLSGPSYRSLKQSILTYRGLIHPIIVNKGNRPVNPSF